MFDRFEEAAQLLNNASAGAAPWFLRRDGKHYYVEGSIVGQWYAYTGDDEGARRTAVLMVFMQPTVAAMLADVFREHAKLRIESLYLLSLAEAIISIGDSLEKQRATV